MTKKGKVLEVKSISNTDKKLNDSLNYIENGIREVGKEEGLNYDVNVYVKQKKSNMQPSVFVIQNFAMQCATQLKFSSATYRILMYFIGLCEFENFLSIDQYTISDVLDISIKTVNRGLKDLLEQNIIISYPHPTDKRRNDYFINPNTMWKGKEQNRKARITKDKNTLELPFYTRD